MTEEKQKKSGKKEKQLKTAPQNTQPIVGESTVLIGRKPTMNYVLACLTYLNSGSSKIVVKARGRAIPRAVDTIELLRRSLAQSLQLGAINLSTEEVQRREGQKAKVSSIEIAVSKQ